MFVITPEELEARGRVKFPADKSFRSARYLTADEDMGFSYNENTVAAGTDLTVWLKHHWEVNYIVSGRGDVTDLADQRQWSLRPGVLYVVGPNDRHRLRFTEDECHISIFYPPLTGNERFDADGSYEASGPIPITKRRMFVRNLDEQQLAGQQTTSTNGQVRTVQLLTEADNVGFCLSVISFAQGSDHEQPDGDKAQANHVISGSGQLTDLTTGEAWEIKPSTAFCVGPNDRYRLSATGDMQILNVRAAPERCD